jgi:hypothetical protein
MQRLAGALYPHSSFKKKGLGLCAQTGGKLFEGGLF